MSVKIRLARGGSKKRPFYSIVVANSTSPRDGRFISKIGIYNPLIAHDNPERLRIDIEQAQEWISKGAQPTDRVAKLLELVGAKLPESVKERIEHLKNNPKKAPRKEAKAS